MSFGYNADVWMTKSVADLDVPVRDLLHSLQVERQEVNRSYAYTITILNTVRIPHAHYFLLGIA